MFQYVLNRVYFIGYHISIILPLLLIPSWVLVLESMLDPAVNHILLQQLVQSALGDMSTAFDKTEQHLTEQHSIWSNTELGQTFSQYC